MCARVDKNVLSFPFLSLSLPRPLRQTLRRINTVCWSFFHMLSIIQAIWLCARWCQLQASLLCSNRIYLYNTITADQTQIDIEKNAHKPNDNIHMRVTHVGNVTNQLAIQTRLWAILCENSLIQIYQNVMNYRFQYENNHMREKKKNFITKRSSIGAAKTVVQIRFIYSLQAHNKFT